ncbi:MAG: 4-alpha-glucanotransferase, partial [Clostridia bacterium]|nr:4-alpha-glucanotransferase [Clostridia bacterium]
MAVSSLPSDYGIGSFGKEAFEFIDFLKKTGQKVWQVLPLNPTAYGDSPYQSPASLAGNPYFIDLEILFSKGLITKEELDFSRHDTERIDYGWLFENRYKILRAAYSRFTKDGLYVDFLNKNSYWLEDYALFMALKEVNNYCQWSSWAEDQKDYKKAISQKAKYEDKMDFWRFLQFEFFTQWQAVLDYAHQNGVVIVGDMPIYVAYDSVDVWSDTQAFLLDENFNPTLVAGCPPDGFSIDGQLWGNPIYNWEKMEQDGFKWWIKRTSHSLKMYDILRIDHFRGFAGYYCVKFGEPTARNGWWQPCVGKALFKVIREKVPALKVIAEDLGLITPDVVELLKQTGYPGMKPLQFAFYDDDSE